MWKMLLYCAVLPALVLGGVFLYCQHVGLDGQALEQTRRNFFILPTGCVLMFIAVILAQLAPAIGRKRIRPGKTCERR